VGRQPLEREAGRGLLLFFDCFSGVAGDMTIAALLDLGVPLDIFQTALQRLPIDGYELVMDRVERSGIAATSFEVKLAAAQPHRTYGSIDTMLEEADLDEATRALARSIFRRLGEAEAAIHGKPLQQVHFHEVGAIDAIVDIVGAAAGLAYLTADIAASPLPMGRGFVKAQHGVLPLPAPATVSCLKGVPTYGIDIDAELVTPTGAAIVASAAMHYCRWPSIEPLHVGFGAGKRELPDRPNLLRLVLGRRTVEPLGETTHTLIEANVDDMTGELAGHALKALLDVGALDAWATPITMKKGRPALTISALSTTASADTIAHAMLRETTTIGVRMSPMSRLERPRRTVEVDTRFGVLTVKVSGGAYGPDQVKPDFDACAAAAAAHNVPVRIVLEAALAAYRETVEQ